jgi:hypothetical protein
MAGVSAAYSTGGVRDKGPQVLQDKARLMGTFSNETIKWQSIGLGIVVALYLMIPMAQVPLYADGVRKSGLRIGIEGRLHFLGII